MEGEARVSVEPLPHFRMLVGGVVVEDHVHDLSGRHLRLDGVEEADKLLVTMALHAAANDKPDHVAQLVDELRVVGELELLNPVWLETMRVLDALNGTRTNANGFRHHRGSPVGRLDGRIGSSKGDDTLGDIRPEWWDARGSRLIAQEAVITSLHEAFLPAPNTGLRLAGPAHDLMGADAVSAQQDDLGPPDMLMCGVAIPRERCQTAAVTGLESDANTGSHAPDSHATSPVG